MSEAESPEQDLCKNCGFCCDGTLFGKASTFEKEELLVEMERISDKEGFWIKLPCPYFSKCCTVYDQGRPRVCGEYKCSILKSAINGTLSYSDASQLVRQVKEQKQGLRALLPKGDEEKTLVKAFDEFKLVHQDCWDEPGFRNQYSKLILGWALYEHRLEKFVAK